jgi:hypothetical protein
LNAEIRSYLRAHNPDALGSCMSQGKRKNGWQLSRVIAFHRRT